MERGDAANAEKGAEPGDTMNISPGVEDASVEASQGGARRPTRDGGAGVSGGGHQKNADGIKSRAEASFPNPADVRR